YKNRKCTVKVSFVELYNEDLIDLLSEENDGENKPQLMIREDSKGNIIWSGLQEIKVTSVDEITGHLNRGSLNRQVSVTDMNSQSSRSHAIFSVTLSQQKLVSSSSPDARDSPLPTSPTSNSSRTGFVKDNDKGEWVSITSKFHFVDLAGSERLKRTSSIGDRAKEGISINSGLLALGNVISALGDPSRAKNITHIPYRDSKLTRLLQDSLGGNAQTLMIACVSPAEYNVSETINTLKYANRARNIKNIATLKRTSSIGDRAKEGISINSGLLALGNVISALGDPSRAKNITHIPYRDSKLTRLLQDSLGGNAQTLMIACVSPAEYNVSETINTLKYANRARNIKNIATVNQEETGWHDLEHLQNLVLKLRNEIKALKQSVGTFSSNNPGSGRNTPILQPDGRDTPLDRGSGIGTGNTGGRRPSTPSTANNGFQKDVESLEEQLSELQRSYVELSKKHAKTTAELSIYQDNFENQANGLASIKEEENINHNNNDSDDNKSDLFNSVPSSFQETIRPVIEEYEKSIADLESDLFLARAALASIEKQIREYEMKLIEVEDLSYKDKNVIMDLKNQILQHHELEETNETYIKVSQLNSTAENSESIIQKLEAKLAKAEQKYAKANKDASQLGKHLQEREKAYANLEEQFNKEKAYSEEDAILLAAEIDDRDKRIAQLEKKVDELVNEIELESKLCELQKIHVNTVLEFEEIKDKHQSCLDEINELHAQLAEAKSPQFNTVEITPSTPLTDSSFDSQNDPDSLSPYLHAVIQKLQIEFKQLELLHDDKAKGLEAVRQEFARLETNHLTTIEIVEELREEIKRRDALAQLEVMSVMSPDAYTDGGFSAAVSEIDQNDIVHRLRDEVEQLKEEQKKSLDLLSVSDIKVTKNDQIFKIESSILQLKSEMNQFIEENYQKSTTPLDKTNDETINKLQSKIR
ncbi:11441_t:CDS:2, partial [Entrophospora sp. SA101]